MAVNRKLTDAKLRALKPSQKLYKVADGGGLHVAVTPAGGRLWRYKYRFDGKERLFSIGPYPEVSLSRARELHMEARENLAAGLDPSEAKARALARKRLAEENAFENVARRWWERQALKWSERHAKLVMASLESNVFPVIGGNSINTLSGPDILAVLRKVETRGANDLANRLLQRIGAIFRFGVAEGVCESDPSRDLTAALTPAVSQNMRSLSIDELPSFLQAVENGNSALMLKLAMRLIILTAVRTSELLAARWEEFDIENRIWSIPEERMKMGRPHMVPLSSQAINVLEELHELTGLGEYLLPGRSYTKPHVSDMALLMVVRRAGFKDRTTVHGFRSMFSTEANESNLWNPDAIERQLAHVPKDKVRSAYNKAQYLPERIKMMEWWGDKIQ